jgi:hypothetical protein
LKNRNDLKEARIMTVEKFAEKFGYEILCMPEPTREISGGYAGDFLSWVMGRLQEGEAWVTIMSNVNVIAVATLADPSCVILSENVSPEDGVIDRAKAQGVNMLRSVKSTYEVCADIKEAV